jgi:hypothetical protein
LSVGDEVSYRIPVHHCSSCFRADKSGRRPIRMVSRRRGQLPDFRSSLLPR